MEPAVSNSPPFSYDHLVCQYPGRESLYDGQGLPDGLSSDQGLRGRHEQVTSPFPFCSILPFRYKCQPQTQLESAAHFHLSYILLCLENAAHAQKENAPSQDCQREMLQHRQMMLSEFRMAPELVMSCAQEIDQWCSPRGDIEGQGITLHCLMQHAQVCILSSFQYHLPF